jgi:hypothetical protein
LRLSLVFACALAFAFASVFSFWLRFALLQLLGGGEFSAL